MIRILANDGLHEDGKLLLEEAGYEVDVIKVAQEDLLNVLPDYNVVIVRSDTKIRKNLIDRCPDLKMIVRGGMGYDNIDVDTATRLRIPIGFTPDAMSEATADIAFGLMIAVARKMFFLHKKGLRGLARGSRFVWVIMCVWAPLGMQMLLLLPSFDRDIDVRNFEIIFSI